MKIAFALVPLLFAGTALAADRLPLRDGDYNSASCAGRPDIVTSIGLYRGVLSPNGDDRDGYCTIRRVRVSGNVYSGSAACVSGGRAASPDGTYDFRYTVLDASTFISNGKTYRWCAAHR